MYSERPELVLVIGSLEGGGAERQMSHMANCWAAKGWQVTLATWAGSDTADFHCIDSRVRRVHLNVTGRDGDWFASLRSSARRLRKLRKLLVSSRPDAVLSFITESNVLTLLAAAGLGLRVVVSERVQPASHVGLHWKWKLLRRAIYAQADEVVTQTQDAARWIRLNCRKQARVIPNMLRPLPHASVERQPLILAVGRLASQKGFDLLLRAFARIAADFPRWRVTIIGEGRERARLVNLRDELQLRERVTFAGQVQDVESWMARAGILVQPSRFEGFPNVVMEGMGMGAAVISADCPSGPADLIEDGVNGRLVPVDDIETLAGAMVELMTQPDVRLRLGQEASKVRQRFHQDGIMAQWEACLLRGNARAEVRSEPSGCT